MSWDWYPPSKPRRPANGIQAKTARGAFGKSWWASQWIAALERLVDPGRLGRGRSYARSGQVLNIDIAPGNVKSRVQGSMPQPYKVDIEITALTDKEWNRVIDAMAAQAVFAAKLLAGEMPQNIEEAFATAKVSLFPAQRGDLQTECSCPDYANPCKHIAAVYYLLGEQFDEDPFLIFRLRGRDKDAVLEALRARRTAAPAPAAKTKRAKEISVAPAETYPALAECVENFWDAPALPALRFTFAPPEVPAAPVKRLGPAPFWTLKTPLSAAMEHAYTTIAEQAQVLAVGE